MPTQLPGEMEHCRRANNVWESPQPLQYDYGRVYWWCLCDSKGDVLSKSEKAQRGEKLESKRMGEKQNTLFGCVWDWKVVTGEE